jgi:hypothetical protein
VHVGSRVGKHFGERSDGGLLQEALGGSVGLEKFADLRIEFAVGPASPFEKVRTLRLGLFEDELKEALDLTISFGGHDGSAKIVCLI